MLFILIIIRISGSIPEMNMNMNIVYSYGFYEYYEKKMKKIKNFNTNPIKK